MNTQNRVDVLIVHANVFTADPNQPVAQAAAVAQGRIAFVGSDQDAESLRSKAGRVIDAGGATLIPGFIDSHFHLLWGSLELGDAPLGGAESPEHLESILQEYAANNSNNEWIVGRGLLYHNIPNGLTRQQIDAAVPDRPVLIFSYDGHTAWANTEALRRGGILRGLETPPGSQIIMALDSIASGELREPGAFNPVLNRIPEPSDHRKREALQKGLGLLASSGITSVHNMNGDIGEIALYAALEDLEELTTRVYVPFHVIPEMGPERLAEAVKMRELHQSAMVRGGAVKFFMDGVIESTTALMLDEFADAPGNFGSALFSAEHFNEMAIAVDKLGLQIFVHAIGDGAVRRTLDGYEAARTANGLRDSRHRVEHIELIHPDDIPRFAQLGVIASMQPLHAPVIGADVWPDRVGTQRWDRSFAWQTLRDAGARLVFGSDWPVVTFNPIKGLHAALTRQPWQDGLPDQRQTLESALLSYTRDAAFAEFQETEKGMIKVGMLADLVLLSENLFSLPPEAISQVRSVMTMVGGRIVHEG